ncbi:MAG: LCP family protein [Clostridia bacterium]|jgi:LCP family protein required for cell wall assembly|nr:LCP family protein [Clostridia bacterium]
MGLEEFDNKANGKGRRYKTAKEKKTEKIINKYSPKDSSKRSEKKKKKNIPLRIFIIILIVCLIGTIICAGIFIGNKIGKINFKSLNEDNLAINDNLYNELSNDLTRKEYDNIINILLLGSDSKDMNNVYAGTSDAQMIISINPKYKSIKLISIPRDTAANIEGMNRRYKINQAFYLGKEELAIKTINQTFGLGLKEYVTINISAMYDIINELGGVDVTITKDEMNSINEYIDMFYEFSGRPVKKVTKYGKITLTGEQAAAHVKERIAGPNTKSSEHGDYGRTRRQRDVFSAMLNKIARKDIGEISRIIDMILEQVTTNVNVTKYMTMLPEFITNKDAYLKNVTSIMLPGLDYSKEILENGAYLYVTNETKAKADFRKYMYEM